MYSVLDSHDFLFKKTLSWMCDTLLCTTSTMYDPIIVSNRYKDLGRNAVKIASKAAKTKESSVFFAKKMVELDLDAERILKKRSHLPSNDIVTDPSHNEHVDVASGINAYKAMGINGYIQC